MPFSAASFFANGVAGTFPPAPTLGGGVVDTGIGTGAAAGVEGVAAGAGAGVGAEGAAGAGAAPAGGAV